jgi:transcriptional regulator with XRE-family HTH domain
MTYYDQYLREIGILIKRLRAEKGWTQAQLARKAADLGAPVVHRQEISQMENGQFLGSVRKLQAVLRTLRYTLTATVARKPQLEELETLFGDED